MVFSSLVFLFFFLPCVVILYYMSPNRTIRNAVLLAFSLLFYAWGEPKALLLLLASTAVAYIGAVLMESFRERKSSLYKITYAVTLSLIIGNLFLFKYFNFTVRNLESVMSRSFNIAEIALPIGISFYTFQTLSYVIDLHRQNIKVQKNPFWLLLYISLFPQLIAGPIVRYQTVEEEILCRKESLLDVRLGLDRFIVGLAKKVILANNAALICEAIYGGNAGTMGTAAYWLAALAYTLQIYFDFSGYSDMAIGLGRIFGFHFLENFNYPYCSLSITEFWRRWHISLSSWFRDYVYIPLGGNRVSRPRWLVNILVVWMLTGFWHGAEWNFIFWGLYYALLLIGEKFCWGKFLEKAPKLLRWCYTSLFVVVGWVLFYNSNFSNLLLSLSKMFTFSPTVWAGQSFDANIALGMPFAVAGLFFIFPPGKLKEAISRLLPQWMKTCVSLGVLAVCVMFILGSSFNPFIYFRF